MIVGEDVARLVELAAHHQAVEVMGGIVAPEALQDVSMGDDARSRQPPGVGLLIE